MLRLCKCSWLTLMLWPLGSCMALLLPGMGGRPGSLSCWWPRQMRKPGAMCLAFHTGSQMNHAQSVSAIETWLEGPIYLFMLFFNFLFYFYWIHRLYLFFIVICLRPYTDLRDGAAWRPTEDMALFYLKVVPLFFILIDCYFLSFIFLFYLFVFFL